jgi:hypothetical protein
MFGSLNDAVIAMKDKALQAGLRAFLNRQYERFGSITRLEIDSRARRMDVELSLKGESEPIQIEVCAYELVEREGRMFIRVLDAKASRKWLTGALAEFVVGKELAVPEAARLAL